MYADTACLDYDIGLQDTFWTGPGEGNWGRAANCTDYFKTQSDPASFCSGKIGGSQTFAERYAKWSGKEEHATAPKVLDFSAFPQDATMWDYFCGDSCAKLGVFAAHCVAASPSPPSQPAPPASPPPPPDAAGSPFFARFAATSGSDALVAALAAQPALAPISIGGRSGCGGHCRDRYRSRPVCRHRRCHRRQVCLLLEPGR